MPNTASKHYWKVISIAGALVGLVAWPGIGQAQLGGITDTVTSTTSTITGTTDTLTGTTGTLTGSTGTLTTGGSQAAASQAIVMGIVTSLADTGTLTSPSEPLGTGLAFGSISGLLTAESLHAATMGWTDQVVSEASLSNLVMTVAGMGISADFILSRALAVAGAGSSGLTSIEGLTIGGMSVSPSGVPNEVVSISGLSVILNEQIQSASGIVVNALRVRTWDGSTDVVLGSAKAGI